MTSYLNSIYIDNHYNWNEMGLNMGLLPFQKGHATTQNFQPGESYHSMIRKLFILAKSFEYGVTDAKILELKNRCNQYLIRSDNVKIPNKRITSFDFHFANVTNVKIDKKQIKALLKNLNKKYKLNII